MEAMLSLTISMRGVMIENVIERASLMAMEKVSIGMRYSAWKYRIKDNPYAHHKKNSVIWHNAFYDKCKEIGRHI